jgi:hypothetical protein
MKTSKDEEPVDQDAPGTCHLDPISLSQSRALSSNIRCPLDTRDLISI